jgi:hypothetical protein
MAVPIDPPTLPTPAGGIPVPTGAPQAPPPSDPATTLTSTLTVQTPLAAESGFTTSEFWGKVAVQFIALLTLLGVVHPSSGTVDGIVGLVGLVGPELGYAISRGIRKRGTPV